MNSTQTTERARTESVLEAVPSATATRLLALGQRYQERGILNSELAAICGVAEVLKVRRIIESGRWLGHSTEILSEYFRGTPVKIESIDYMRTQIGVECEARLRNRPNVVLYYGDAFKVIPGIIVTSQAPALLLIDGPKGRAAVRLIQMLMDRYPQIVGAFLHDTYLGSEARAAVEETFPACAFTDHPAFVERFHSLDRSLPVGTFAPTKYSGDPLRSRQPLSYGPTLAFILRSGSESNARLPGWLDFPIQRARFYVGREEARLKSKLRQMKYALRPGTEPGKTMAPDDAEN
jgi:hypothetical protein